MGVVLPADDVLVAGLRAGDEETFACLLHRARAAVRGHLECYVATSGVET
ncbi:hypothetical protein ACWCOV_20300 [Kribbella sp. NPDC002412]